LHKDKLAEPYHLYEAQGDMEIAMSCCRYLSIVFRPEFPPAEANEELPAAEVLSDYMSGKSLLVYALENFQAHLDHLGSSNEKVRDEFMKFVKLLISRSGSYASLILEQWIRSLKWPTDLRVDKTSARLYLHSLLLYISKTKNKAVARVLLSLRSDLLHIQVELEFLDTTRFSIAEFEEIWNSVELLLDIGADADSKDTAGRTPLSYAAESGLASSINLLFSKGAYLDSQDTTGRTPLSYAARNGHLDSTKLLLQARADIDLTDTAGRTPMSYAAENGHTNSIKMLLMGDADLDLKDTVGRTPLSYAAQNGHDDSVKLLLVGGADIDSKDAASRTPLSYAAENGHKNIVLQLLIERASIDSKDAASQTPLSHATAHGHAAVVELLQSYSST
jgi:ankyrin repeat protein